MLQGTDADSYSAGWIDLAISTHREGPAQGQLLCDLHQLVRLNQTQSNLVLLCLVTCYVLLQRHCRHCVIPNASCEASQGEASHCQSGLGHRGSLHFIIFLSFPLSRS